MRLSAVRIPLFFLAGLLALAVPAVAQRAAKHSVSTRSAKRTIAPEAKLRFDPKQMNSVSYLQSYLRKLKEAEKRKEASKETKRAEKEGREEDPDFLESYLYFLRQRAYPNNSFDFSVYDKARSKRVGMPAASPTAKPSNGRSFHRCTRAPTRTLN